MARVVSRGVCGVGCAAVGFLVKSGDKVVMVVCGRLLSDDK